MYVCIGKLVPIILYPCSTNIAHFWNFNHRVYLFRSSSFADLSHSSTFCIIFYILIISFAITFVIDSIAVIRAFVHIRRLCSSGHLDSCIRWSIKLTISLGRVSVGYTRANFFFLDLQGKWMDTKILLAILLVEHGHPSDFWNYKLTYHCTLEFPLHYTGKYFFVVSQFCHSMGWIKSNLMSSLKQEIRTYRIQNFSMYSYFLVANHLSLAVRTIFNLFIRRSCFHFGMHQSSCSLRRNLDCHFSFLTWVLVVPHRYPGTSLLLWGFTCCMWMKGHFK